MATRKKDGTVINVDITSSRLTFGGRPAEFVLVHDVTERKKAETALRISEDRYRDLVDNSHELICTHDLEGRVSVNPWAARVLGYPQRLARRHKHSRRVFCLNTALSLTSTCARSLKARRAA